MRLWLLFPGKRIKIPRSKSEEFLINNVRSQTGGGSKPRLVEAKRRGTPTEVPLKTMGGKAENRVF